MPGRDDLLSSPLFDENDHVRVAEDLGPTMSHFTSDVEAIVRYSYMARYGGGEHDPEKDKKERDRHQYCLYIKGQGECSWYYGSQLTLIAKDAWPLLKQWRQEFKEARTKGQDLDYIFANGPRMMLQKNERHVEGKGSSSPYTFESGDAVIALARCLGLSENELWGPHGEGVTYYLNSVKVLATAGEFLKKKDKAGWLEFCATAKENKCRDA